MSFPLSLPYLYRKDQNMKVFLKGPHTTWASAADVAAGHADIFTANVSYLFFTAQ
jgi:hypothetical protein